MNGVIDLTCPTTRDSGADRLWAVLLAMIALGALALRGLTLAQSLWLDELHTSWVVSGSLRQVAERAAAGNQAPIYYWSSWLLLSLLPSNELTLRASSWLASGALVIAVGCVAKRWSGSRTLGMLAATLVAADPNCIYYGREARPYAWVALLALVHVVVFRRRLILSVATSTRRYQGLLRIAWIALSWSLFYTHFTSLLLIAGELAYLAVTPYGRRLYRRNELRTWTTDIVCLVLGCIPALPLLLQIGRRRDNWSQFVERQGWTATWTLFPCNLYVGAAIVVATGVVVADTWRRRPFTTHRLRAFVPLLWCWYVVPVGVAWALTFWGLAPLFHRRYVWVVAASLFLHVAICGTVAAHRAGRNSYAVLMILLAATYWIRLPNSTWTIHSHEDWRSAWQRIDASESTHDWPVLLRSGLIEDRELSRKSSPAFREYCSFPLRGLYSLNQRTIVPLSSGRIESLDSETRQILTRAPGAWFIYRGSVDKALQVIELWQRQIADANGELTVMQVESFAGLTLCALYFGDP